MSTRQDIVDLVALFRAAFPNYNPDSAAMGALYSLLSDIPGDTLFLAARACIAEPGRAFAPSVGELRGKLVELARRAAGIPTAWEAWTIISTQRERRWYYNCPTGDGIKAQAGQAQDSAAYWRALSNYKTHLAECGECGWRVDAVAMPEIVRRVAEGLGWPERFPNSELLEVDRAHFVRSYEDAVNRATSQAAEPADVHAYIATQAGQAIKSLAAGMSK